MEVLVLDLDFNPKPTKILLIKILSPVKKTFHQR